MSLLTLLVLFVCIIANCTAFWFYGYDQSYRDPLPETTDNEIVQTSVITYLASIRNTEITGHTNPYTYKLIMFESIIQYETASPSNEWNLGLWAGFIYCDEDNDSLCLYFNDGQYCDNGYFRETAIELTCNYDAVATTPVLYDIVEEEECVYSGKVYLPELCSKKGKSTQFLRDIDQVEKIRASSYISDKGNKIAVLPYQMLSGAHQIGLSMTVNEMQDYIRITLYGPLDRYFGVGFGSNGMLNTYAIIINAWNAQNAATNDVFFEQLLGSHNAGYTLEPSFVVAEHSVHSTDGVQQITLERPLSSAVDIDEYWIFSCADADIDIIWSVGSDATFARHLASGQDKFEFNMQQVADYDKNAIIDYNKNAFTLHINWTALFFVFCLLGLAWYAVKKYRQQIVAFGTNLSSNMNLMTAAENEDNTVLRKVTKEYGSAQDVEPLISGQQTRLNDTE